MAALLAATVAVGDGAVQALPAVEATPVKVARLPVLSTPAAISTHQALDRLPPLGTSVQRLPSPSPVGPLPTLLPSEGEQSDFGPPAVERLPTPPPVLAVWWDQAVRAPLSQPSQPLPLGLQELVVATIQYSPQVRMLAIAPLVRETGIEQADAKFDPRAFLESKFVDTSDPVGSTLTTGGPDRWLDENWTMQGGIRKRLPSGGQLEASQSIGYEDSNSLYFIPPFQGNSRIVLGLTQPLLHGAGSDYNLHLVLLAQIDTRVAREQFSKDMQDLLLELHRAYWELYLQRAVLLQKTRLQHESQVIYEMLEARREADVLGSQLARARAAVATRTAAVIRSQTSVRNVEARLRAIVQDPRLLAPEIGEFIPAELPQRAPVQVDMMELLGAALACRPEINQLLGEIQAASVRAEVARKDLLPVLNAVLNSYVSGLRGNGDIATAWGDQFTQGRPSYSAGLVFEVPWGNREANARLLQRRRELEQLTYRLHATSATVRMEVEIAAREVATAQREMETKIQAIDAEEAEIRYLADRWRNLPGEQYVAGVLLDNLLSAQDRLAQAEFDFANAEVAYNVSLVALRRATGTLIRCEELAQIESQAGVLPVLPIKEGRGWRR